MKKYFAITFLFIFMLKVLGQHSPGVNTAKGEKNYSENDTVPKVIYPNHHGNELPLYEINGKLMAMTAVSISALGNPQDIESMHIEKKEFSLNNSKYYGKTTLTFKPNLKLKIVSVPDFVLKYTKIKENYIVSIDGDVVNADLENTFVNENYIMKVEVKKLEKIKNPKNLYAINLITRTTENLKKANEIRIR